MAFRNDRRSRATQDEVLRGFADRLAQIPDMNKETVVISDQPVPMLMPQGGIGLVVAPGDSSFDVGAAHAEAFRDLSGVIVGIYILNRRDRPGRSESRIVAKNSLLWWKRTVLSFLALENTRTVGQDQIPLLRSIPVPTKATSPRDVPDHDSWIGMQIYYQVEFDWDLYDGIFG
jgi:hypothetical protein